MAKLTPEGAAAQKADDNTPFRPGSAEHWNRVAAAAIAASPEIQLLRARVREFEEALEAVHPTDRAHFLEQMK